MSRSARLRRYAAVFVAGALGSGRPAIAAPVTAPVLTGGGEESLSGRSSGISTPDPSDVLSLADPAGKLAKAFHVKFSPAEKWGLVLGFGYRFQDGRRATGPDSVLLAEATTKHVGAAASAEAGAVSLGASGSAETRRLVTFVRGRRGAETLEQALAAPIPTLEAFRADPKGSLFPSETISFEDNFKLEGEVSVGAKGVELGVGASREVRLQVTVRCVSPELYVVRYEPAKGLDLTAAVGLGPLSVGLGRGHTIGMYYELRRNEAQLKTTLASGDLFGQGAIPKLETNVIMNPAEGTVSFSPALVKAFDDLPDLVGVGFSRESTISAEISTRLFTNSRSTSNTASFDLARDAAGKFQLRADDGQIKAVVSSSLSGAPRQVRFEVMHHAASDPDDTGLRYERTVLAHRVSRDGLSNEDAAKFLVVANTIFQRGRGREFALAGLEGGLGNADLVATLEFDAATMKILLGLELDGLTRAAVSAGIGLDELHAVVQKLRAEPNEVLQARLLGRWVYGTHFAVTGTELARMAAIERAVGKELVTIELTSAAYRQPLDAADALVLKYRDADRLDLSKSDDVKTLIGLLGAVHVARRELAALRETLRGNTLMSEDDRATLVETIRDKLAAVEHVAAVGQKVADVGAMVDLLISDLVRRNRPLTVPTGQGGVHVVPADSVYGYHHYVLADAILALIEEHTRRRKPGSGKVEDHVNLLLTGARTRLLLERIRTPQSLGELAGFLIASSDPSAPAGQERIRDVTRALANLSFGHAGDATRSMIAYAGYSHVDIQTNLDEIIGDLVKNLSSTWSAFTAAFGGVEYRENVQVLRRLAGAASPRGKGIVMAALLAGVKSGAKQEAIRTLIEDLSEDPTFAAVLDPVGVKLKEALAGSVDQGYTAATIIAKHPTPSPLMMLLVGGMNGDGVMAMMRTLVRRDEGGSLRKVDAGVLETMIGRIGGGGRGMTALDRMAKEVALSEEVRSFLALLRDAQKPVSPEASPPA